MSQSNIVFNKISQSTFPAFMSKLYLHKGSQSTFPAFMKFSKGKNPLRQRHRHSSVMIQNMYVTFLPTFYSHYNLITLHWNEYLNWVCTKRQIMHGWLILYPLPSVAEGSIHLPYVYGHKDSTHKRLNSCMHSSFPVYNQGGKNFRLGYNFFQSNANK